MCITHAREEVINDMTVDNLFIIPEVLIHISTEKKRKKFTHNSSTGKRHSYTHSYALHTFNALDQLCDNIIELHIFIAFPADFVMCMNDGCMVTAAKHFANARQ